MFVSVFVVLFFYAKAYYTTLQEYQKGF